MLNAAGHGIGMAVFGPRRRVLVIPAATAQIALPRASKATAASTAVTSASACTQSASPPAAPGVMVMSIDAKGSRHRGRHAAGRAVIVACNGQAIRGIQSLLASLGPDSPGTTVTLSAMLRGGAPGLKKP